MSPRQACSFAAFLLAAATAQAAEVTPYRPTVSNPAALSAPGRFEIEAGFARGRDADARTGAVPYLLKYAFTGDFGVLLGGDAFLRRSDAAGVRLSGDGDTTVAVKWRSALGGEAALGVEAGLRLPTSSRGLGTEKTDVLVTGIYSAGFGGWEADFNLGFVHFGERVAGLGPAGLSWAAAVARGIGGPWSIALEISGSARRGNSAQAQALGAIAYRVSRTVSLDAGMSRGLSDGNTWTAFAGLAVLLDRP